MRTEYSRVRGEEERCASLLEMSPFKRDKSVSYHKRSLGTVLCGYRGFFYPLAPHSMRTRKDYTKRLLAQIHEILPAASIDELVLELNRRNWPINKARVRLAIKHLRIHENELGWSIPYYKRSGLYYIVHINEHEQEFMRCWYPIEIRKKGKKPMRMIDESEIEYRKLLEKRNLTSK